ncbi:MAG: ATP-binding cassette domain-containing protein [Lachnospiraceae bacterium]|nr:ATP-binding cassette domain-containing protein [Lachnospiraceae bacterium]
MISKLFSVFDGKQKAQLFGLGVMILIGGLFETLGVSMMLPVMGAVMDPAAVRGKIMSYPVTADLARALRISDSDTRFVVTMLIVLIAIFVLKNLYILFLTWRQSTFITRTRNEMISRVMREFLNRPYEEYLGADIPTVFRITDSDIPKMFSMVVAALGLATEMIVSFCILVVLLVVNWKLTLFIAAIFLAITLFNLRFLKPRLNAIGKENQAIQSRIAKWRIEAIYGLKDVKVLNREDFFIRNYYESGSIGADTDRRYTVLNNLPRLLIETVFMGGVFAFLAIYLGTGGDVRPLMTQLMAFAAAAVRVMPSANRINTYLTEIAYEQPSLDYVYENFSEAMKQDKAMRAVQEESRGPAITLTDRIELTGITYRYPGTEKNIFTDAGFSVEKGRSVGIIGASGAGKSTIVDILLGLLHVQKGLITCDGVNVFDNYPSWLHQIGYIPQSIYLVDESIRDNIAFGIDADRIDEARLWEVLGEAQLADFVRELPEGLDTRIGDRGVRLSGGQRQRIGIARALYHDPEILVFDEATSALDGETEQALMDAINSFHGKKTMIIIAHRLNTIAKCDRIYEVKDEKILETTLAGKVVYER